MKKQLFLIAAAILSASVLQAQSFIQTVGGECYWTNADINASSKIEVFAGQRIYNISTDSIAVVVDMERGTRVLKPESVTAVEPQQYKKILPAVATGKKVYVPVTSSVEEQRAGSRRLTELLLQDRHWHLVATPEQADFILGYNYDASGHDKAKLCLYDRSENKLAWTASKGARNKNAERAGVESAEKLYGKYLKDGIYQDKLSGWNSKLHRPAGLYARASVAGGINTDFDDNFRPAYNVNLQLGYRVSPIFAISLGAGLQTLHMHPANSFWEYSSSDDAIRMYYSSYNYSYGWDEVKGELKHITQTVYTIPLTFNMRLNTSLRRNLLYFELGGGWCLPISKKVNLQSSNTHDLNYYYTSEAKLSGTLEYNKLFLSAELGLAFADFEVGFFTTVTGKAGTCRMNFDVWEDTFGHNYLCYSYRKNVEFTSVPLFMGFRFSYNLTLTR